MKKISIILSLLVGTFLGAQSMFTVTLDNDAQTQIVNNHSFDFNVVGYPEANVGFHVNNITDEPIVMRIYVEEIINDNGSNMELCFGECYTGIIDRERYPLESFVGIPAQSNQGNGDHFLLFQEPNTNELVEYKFIFERYSVPDLVLTDDILTVYYRYQANMSVMDAERTDAVSVYPTLTRNNLNIKVQENASVTLHDMTGKQLQQLQLNAGTHTLDVSRYGKGNFVLTFQTQSGLKTSKKIMVQ
ncbi:MAG: T9SS type A sorting domain-containing protein [Weeksellaceae bacterium]|nr:T9SS type A sorting domain-containing protein [Weeksellaceae bacterium]